MINVAGVAGKLFIPSAVVNIYKETEVRSQFSFSFSQAVWMPQSVNAHRIFKCGLGIYPVSNYISLFRVEVFGCLKLPHSKIFF